MEYDDRMTLLQEWNNAVSAAASAKQTVDRELVLRKAVMVEFFPIPEEGVNAMDMGQGWTLKATYKIDRKVDAAALPAIMAKLRELGVKADPLIRYKPEISVDPYRALPDEARKIFDTALIIKPGSPTVALIPPKEEK